jgi:hypothetical protein
MESAIGDVDNIREGEGKEARRGERRRRGGMNGKIWPGGME